MFVSGKSEPVMFREKKGKNIDYKSEFVCYAGITLDRLQLSMGFDMSRNQNFNNFSGRIGRTGRGRRLFCPTAQSRQPVCLRTTQAPSSARGSRRFSESEDIFRCLIHMIGQAPIGLLVSREGRVLFASAALERITGYSSEVLGTLGVEAMIYPDDLPLMCGDAPGRGEGDCFRDVRLVRRTGELRWVRIRRSRTIWKGTEVLIEMVTDISSFKQTESDLKRSQARLRDAQKLASMGNWEYKEKETVHISRTLYDLFHCSERERKNGFRALWKRVHPEDRSELRSTFTPDAGTSRFFDHEFRYCPEPGEVRYAHAIGVTRPAGEEGRFHSYGTLQDVTEFRQLAEEALEAKDRAERASRSKTAFLARMSHEVRTPLNAVMGMLFMLEESGLNEKQAGFVRGAHQAADGLLCVLNQVLDLAGIESGSVSLDQERFSLGALLKGVCQGFAGQAAGKKLRLTHELDPDFPEYIVTDKGRLRQILFNLVANAIKFTDAGTVSIQACRAGKGRRLNTVRLLLSVSDTGSGISREDQEQVFNTFSRGTDGSAHRVPGSGLGLAIVRELADLFGGHIALESAPGEGTTVHFCCMVREGESDPAYGHPGAGARCEDSDTVGSGLHVLVAEDHPLNQMYAVMLLEKMGYRVDAVRTGREAVDACARTPYDLVFMDVEMPEMDGLEACALIRSGAVPGCPADVPIVALTGHTMTEDVHRFRAAGMDGHLAKPVSRESFEQVVFEVLSER